jgi:hypothetical protein
VHLGLAQLIWFGLGAAIIVVDKRLIQQRVTDEPDLTDRGVGQYLMLMLLFGGFVIPFYMWNSRRTHSAVLAGIGLMLVCGLIVALVARI